MPGLQPSAHGTNHLELPCLNKNPSWDLVDVKPVWPPGHPAMTVLVGSGNQLPSATSGAGLLNTTSMGQACSYLKSTARIEAAGQKFRGNNRCADFKEQAWALTERVDLLAGLEEIESQGLGPAAGRGVGD